MENIYIFFFGVFFSTNNQFAEWKHGKKQKENVFKYRVTTVRNPSRPFMRPGGCFVLMAQPTIIITFHSKSIIKDVFIILFSWIQLFLFLICTLNFGQNRMSWNALKISSYSYKARKYRKKIELKLPEKMSSNFRIERRWIYCGQEEKQLNELQLLSLIHVKIWNFILFESILSD